MLTLNGFLSQIITGKYNDRVTAIVEVIGEEGVSTRQLKEHWGHFFTNYGKELDLWRLENGNLMAVAEPVYPDLKGALASIIGDLSFFGLKGKHDVSQFNLNVERFGGVFLQEIEDAFPKSKGKIEVVINKGLQTIRGIQLKAE